MAAPRTLFIHAGALGDFVLTLSLVQAIAESQSAPVTMLARGEFAPIAALCPEIDRMVDINASPWHKLFGDEPNDAIDTIGAIGPLELVVDAMGISKKASVALQKAGVEQYVCFDPSPIQDDHRHITAQWVSRLDLGGLALPPIRPPDLQPPANPVEFNESIHNQLAHQLTTNRITVIHVGSGGRAKCWPLDRFIELARLLRADGHTILFPLGEAESNRDDIKKLRDQFAAAGATVEAPTLTEFIAILHRATIFLGNDSGPTHLAAAIGVPTIAIFGPTDSRIWAPLGDRVFVVDSVRDCSQVDWPTPNRLFKIANRAFD